MSKDQALLETLQHCLRAEIFVLHYNFMFQTGIFPYYNFRYFGNYVKNITRLCPSCYPIICTANKMNKEELRAMEFVQHMK